MALHVRNYWVNASVSALLWCSAGCADPPAEEEPLTELKVATQQWHASRPVRYEYAIARQCYCSSAYLGPVRLRVDGEDVVAREYVDGGGPVPAEVAEAFPSVDGLFGLIGLAYLRGAHEVRVRYDPVLGVPLEIWIDAEEYTIDEELGIEVTESVAAVGVP